MRSRAAGTALALLALGARLAPAQDPGAPPTPAAGSIRRVFTVGNPVVGQDRSVGLAFFSQDPVKLGEGVSVIHRVADDGSLFMSDYVGASLIRFKPKGAQIASLHSSGSSSAEILLDSSHRDPADGVGLARILQVATNGRGVSAIVALRADATYCIYRLENGRLIRLFDPTDVLFSQELAISDEGQIAYVGPNKDGYAALYQTTKEGQRVQIVSVGAAHPVRVGSGTAQVVVGGSTIDQLAANGAGDLVFKVSLADRPDGPEREALLRRRGNTLELVAQQGDPVARGRGAEATDRLETPRHPRIGPDGTVVFQGCLVAEEVRNYFTQAPGGPLQPLLPANHWVLDTHYEWGFEYAVDARGTVALLAQRENEEVPWIYRVTRDGKTELIFNGRPNIQPVGGLSFDTSGNLFFLARNRDLPRDRYGNFPVRLYQYQREASSPTGAVREVEIGRSLRQKPGLLSISQKPVFSADAVTFGALSGGSDRFPVPSAALFQVTLGDPGSQRETLVMSEADTLPGADRIGIVQDLRYTGDGTLVVDVALPGGGSAAITLPSNATTASRVRTQAMQAAAVVPLIATGQTLGQSDRKLLNFLGPFVPFGADKQLVAARYAQGEQIGEGLFAISRKQQVEALADTIRGGSNTRYTSFSEPTGKSLDVPSVSREGNIVFWAKEDRGGDYPQSGVFQWLRSSGTVVRMFAEQDPLGRFAAEPWNAPSYSPERWAAGPAGTAYVKAQGPDGGSSLFQCSLRPDTLAAQVEPLVIPGVTAVGGTNPSKLTSLADFATDGGGELFVVGETAAGPGLFHWDPNGSLLTPEI